MVTQLQDFHSNTATRLSNRFYDRGMAANGARTGMQDLGPNWVQLAQIQDFLR